METNREMFVRQQYLDEIERWFGKDFIIVLTGQRRVGKSYTLRMISESRCKDGNIIFIDKERREFDYINNYLDLNDYVEAHRVSDRMNYILVDEIQDIYEWEKSVRCYRNEPGVEIVVTGSNAKMLSSELSTLIGGRYKEIFISPLSYREFLEFYGLADCDDSLSKFIQFGGMPGLAKIGLDESEAMHYLLDVFNTVLLKDVIIRNKIRNVVFLQNLVHFLADNVGKQISATSISRYMKSQGEKINSTTILDYIRMLMEAFVVQKVNRYDIHGKRLFEFNDKFYFQDHGIRNALLGGNREGDIEKVIENVIYQELVRRGYKVTVGQLLSGEVDFVCEKPLGNRLYVQASYVIADEQTKDREFGSLKSIKDNYPKCVVSMTPLLTKSDNDGITHIHLRRFLMEEMPA